MTIGIPDGIVDATTGCPKAYRASLVHDAIYQFLPDDLAMSRAQADRCFLALMNETGFHLRHIYYFAIRTLGGMVRLGIRQSREHQGSQVEL